MRPSASTTLGVEGVTDVDSQERASLVSREVEMSIDTVKQGHERDPSFGPDKAKCYLGFGPYRPVSSDLPGRIFPKRLIHNKSRSFQESWYREFAWLEYSPALDAAFYFPCRLAGCRGKSDAAFTINGFRNWKTATQDLKSHEASRCHQMAVPAWGQSLRLLKERRFSCSESKLRSPSNCYY